MSGWGAHGTETRGLVCPEPELEEQVAPAVFVYGIFCGRYF